MLSSRLERDKSLKAAANYDDTPGYTRVSGRFNFSISPPPLPSPQPPYILLSDRLCTLRGCLRLPARVPCLCPHSRVCVCVCLFKCARAREDDFRRERVEGDETRRRADRNAVTSRQANEGS